MSKKLPTKKGEIFVVWQDFERDAEGPVRVILKSDGRGRWSMHTQEGDTHIDDGDIVDEYEGVEYAWHDGGCFHHDFEANHVGLSRIMINAAMATAGYPRLMDPKQAVEDPGFWSTGEHIISRTKGNRRLVVINDGSHCAGGILVSIHSNKPMDIDHWHAALRNLAAACDAMQRRWEGE